MLETLDSVPWNELEHAYIAQREVLWKWGNMAFTVGSFFDLIYPPLFLTHHNYGIWHRKDIEEFLTGVKVFQYE